MNWTQLVIEMKARGFEHIGSRVEQYLQDAYLRDICEEEDWPFLEATKTETIGNFMAISDLRTIRYVINITTGVKLQPLRPDRITDGEPEQYLEGTPEFYYVTEGTQLRLFPKGTAPDEFSVFYWKVPEELSGSAEPLLPKRWHSLIIDGAVARAYRNSDDWELSQAAKTTFEAELQLMKDSLLNQQHDAPNDFVVVEDPAALR